MVRFAPIDSNERLPASMRAALAADLADGGTVEGAALAEAARDILGAALVAGANVTSLLEIQPMWVTGHSWQASTSSTTAGGRWFERVIRRGGMGAATNRAQSGRTIGDIAMATLGGTNGWTPRTKSLVGVCCTINDVTLFDGSAAARRGYSWAWKALLCMLTANAVIPANSSRFVYSSSSTWAASTVVESTAQAAGVASSGGQWFTTSTVADYFEFTFTGTAVDVMLIARAAGAGLVTFTEGGTARGSLDLTSAAAQDTPAVHRISGLSSGTHTIRGTLTSGSSLTVDSYRVPLTKPAPIVVLGEPPVIPAVGDMTGYVAEVEYLKGQLETICAGFSSVVYIDLTRDGWDQTNMIVADGKHPNDYGAAWIATQVLDALADTPYSGGLGTTLNQSYPAGYTPPAGPAVPGGGMSGSTGTTISDNFNRADGAMGSTSTGAKAWTPYYSTGGATTAFGISSNRAKVVSGTGNAVTTIEGSGVIADGSIKATLAVLGSDVNGTAVGGLALRVVDGDNMYMLQLRSSSTVSQYCVVRRTAGTVTTVYTSGVAPVVGDQIEVILSSSTVSVLVNGSEILAPSSVSSFVSTARHGLYGNAVDTTTAWDNFEFIPA